MTDRSWCLFRVTTGQEFTASAALSERHIIHECPTVTVQQTLLGKRQRPKVIEVKMPALPGYLFLLLSAAEWNDLVDRPIKHLWGTMQWLNRGDVLDMLNFIAKVQVMETIREYEPGDELEDELGIFNVMRFVRLVNDSSLIEARTEMMGREVKIQLPPERVRRA